MLLEQIEMKKIKFLTFLIFFIIFSPGVYAQSALIYWTADDCPACKAWEKSEKQKTIEITKNLQIDFIEVRKKSLKEKWSDDLKSIDPRVEYLFSVKRLAYRVPTFSYMSGNEEVFRIEGFNDEWRRKNFDYLKIISEQ